MGALRSLIIVLALQFAAPAHAGPIERWRPYIEDASVRFGIPVAWIERVMRAESAGRTTLDGRPITSQAGAMGLMQLMPGTWAEMRKALRLGSNPHDPRDNILAGAAYLRMMHDRFGYPGLFGAYNAGPARYAAFVSAGRPLPAETRAYLATVGRGSPVTPGSRAITRVNGVFFPLGQRAGGRTPEASSDSNGMFVVVLAQPAPVSPTP